MITSMSNPRVKLVVQLIQKAKVRNRNQLFVVEGLKMLLEAPKKRIQEVYCSESFYETHRQEEFLLQYSYEVVADEVFRKMTDTVEPQGILCTVKQFEYCLEKLIKVENPLLLVVENMQDPGNLGALLRTGEAAGVDGIILTKESVDIYNPKTVRASMGAIYRMKYSYTDSITGVIEELKRLDIATYAAHLEGKAYFTEIDFTSPTAFLIGNESKGLEAHTGDRACEKIKIPMCGRVESLNAAMAAGLLIYEAQRQRRVNN